MLRVSDKLAPYVDYDNGKLIISKDLPKDLEDEAKKLEDAYRVTHKQRDLAEY